MKTTHVVLLIYMIILHKTYSVLAISKGLLRRDFTNWN